MYKLLIKSVIVVFFIISSTCLAEIKTHSISDEYGNQINVSEHWYPSFLLDLGSDASFTLTTQAFEKNMLIEVLPASIVFNNQDQSLTNLEVRARLLQLNNLTGKSDFLDETDGVESAQWVEEGNLAGFIVHIKDIVGDRYTTSILFNDQHTFLARLNSREKHLSELISIFNSYKPANSLIGERDKHYDFSTIQFHLDNNYKLSKVSSWKKGKQPPAAYKVSIADETIFLFDICYSSNIPNRMMLELAIDYYDNATKEIINTQEFVFNDTVFGLMTANYENSSGAYRSVAITWGNKNSCQYTLVHLGDYTIDALSQLLHVYSGIKVDNRKSRGLSNISSEEKKMLAENYNQLGKKYSEIKNHSKALSFWLMAFELAPSKEYAESIIDKYNNLDNYQAGLEFVIEHGRIIDTENNLLWQAWFHKNLNNTSESIELYTKVFSKEFYSEWDFFVFIDLLIKEKKLKLFQSVVNRFASRIQDEEKLSIKKAEMFFQTDKSKAIAYIPQILKQNISHKNYLYLLDKLGEVEAYEEVIKSINQKLEEGYESAVYLNYLGDAQYQLGQNETALSTMQKAARMDPSNDVIGKYARYLEQVVGVDDIEEIKESIQAVKLPVKTQLTMRELKPKYSGFSHEYLYNYQAIYFKAGEKKVTSYYNKIYVRNKKGVELNKTIRFSYNGEYENVYINYFRVLDEQGQVIAELDRNTVYISNAQDQYDADEDKVVHMPVPSLSAGVSVEWAISKQSQNNVTQLNFKKLDFYSQYKRQHKGIYIKGDIDLIQYVENGLTTQKLSETELLWQVDDLAYHEPADYTPELTELYPRLAFATVEKDWVMVGDSYLKEITHKLGTELNIAEQVEIDSLTDDESKVKYLSTFVQKELTYQALEFGHRAYVPNDAAKTLKNKYGDCKDHAVLLFDLLNANNIKANLVLINSSENIIPTLAHDGQFNHMVVYLPEIGDGVFIDVTNKDLGVDLVTPPRGIQGRLGLVLEKNKSRLLKVPAVESEHNLIKVVREVWNESGEFKSLENAELTGYYAGNIRSYLKKIEEDRIKSSVFNWITDHYPEIKLESFSYANLYDNDKPLLLNFQFSIAENENRNHLPVFIEKYIMKFNPAFNRKVPFYFNHPLKLSSKTTHKDKKHSKIKFKKQKREINNGMLTWKLESSKKEIVFEAEIFRIQKAAPYYEQFVSDSASSYRALEYSVLF